MQELLDLENKLAALKAFTGNLKEKRAEVVEVSNLYNKLMKADLKQDEKEKLRQLRKHLDEIRDRYAKASASSTTTTSAAANTSAPTTSPIYFDPSKNLEHKAVLNSAKKSGEDALINGLKDLLIKTPNLNFNYNSENYHPLLCIAARNGGSKLVDFLLDQGAVPNFAGGENTYPIHFAALNNNKALVKLLLDKGANINVKDINGNTPLIVALDRKFYELAEMMMANDKIDVNACESSGKNALHYAVIAGQLALVDKLVKLGANPNQEDNLKATPLTYALNLANSKPGVQKPAFFNNVDKEALGHIAQYLLPITNSYISLPGGSIYFRTK